MSARSLTAGEIALARLVFKDAIDYRDIKVHNRKFVFFQPNNSGMTPNGHIYVVGDRTYVEDYSLQEKRLRGFFIHEMAHVWQYQRKILRPITAAIAECLRHRFDYAKAYKYRLVAGKDLRSYRIEQQAQIIEDYYLRVIAATQAQPESMQSDGATVPPPLYAHALARFLVDPRSA